jgi:methylated-DNA-[protein]-cysteine S-methyltransferase
MRGRTAHPGRNADSDTGTVNSIMIPLFFRSTPSPIGTLYLYACKDHLRRLSFAPLDLSTKEAHSPVLALTVRELSLYFAGTLREFHVPLQLEGTPFEQNAWRALLRIPYGETRSYGEQALMAGFKNAFRAIGSANRRNPIPILVPCHRIIRSDGSIGGYHGSETAGVRIKQFLLSLEARYRTP